MSSTVALLSVSVFLLAGVLQILAAPTPPEDDPVYNLFVMQIFSLQQQAEYKLSSARAIYINNTTPLNIPKNKDIVLTLNKCFEDVKEEYPHDTNPHCLDSVYLDIQQMITDIQMELDACREITHSWELVGTLIDKAEVTITTLNQIIDDLLNQALECVVRYPKNLNLKVECLMNEQRQYQGAWNTATSLTEQAYNQTSAGRLIPRAESSACQDSMTFTFTGKCSAMRSEVVMKCFTITSTEPSITTAPPHSTDPAVPPNTTTTPFTTKPEIPPTTTTTRFTTKPAIPSATITAPVGSTE